MKFRIFTDPTVACNLTLINLIVARKRPPLRETEVIADALERAHARLLMVDPLHSFFGAGVNLRLSGETWPLLDRLALLAEKHRCCVLPVRHLSKRRRG